MHRLYALICIRMQRQPYIFIAWLDYVATQKICPVIAAFVYAAIHNQVK